VADFTLKAAGVFAVSATENQFSCFCGMSNHPALTVVRPAAGHMDMGLVSWLGTDSGSLQWSEFSPTITQPIHHVVSGLTPKTSYRLLSDGEVVTKLVAADNGTVTFDQQAGQAKPVVFTIAPDGGT